MSGVPERWPGSFVVDLDGAMIGQILLRGERGTVARLPWGRPISATCSCRGHGDSGTPPSHARRHSAGSCGALPGEPVVLITQTANVGSMRLAAKLGFTEIERFEAWGAEQWLGMWSPGHAARLSSCSTRRIRRFRPRLVQRDCIRLELGGVVLHDHDTSISQILKIHYLECPRSGVRAREGEGHALAQEHEPPYRCQPGNDTSVAAVGSAVVTLFGTWTPFHRTRPRRHHRKC